MGMGGGNLDGAMWQDATTLAFTASGFSGNSGSFQLIGLHDAVIGEVRFKTDAGGVVHCAVTATAGDHANVVSYMIFDEAAGPEAPLRLPVTYMPGDPIVAKWVEMGGWSGALGCPTGWVTWGLEGSGLFPFSQKVNFERGTITWTFKETRVDLHP